MNKARILFSIPSKSHVEIALDEMAGLQDCGYICRPFPFSSKEGYTAILSRLGLIIRNTVNLVRMSYKFKPDIIYLNSRFEEVAGTRDFITIAIFRILYFRKVLFLIKSHGSDFDVLQSEKFLTKKVVLPFLKKNISGWLFLSSEERSQAIESSFITPEKAFITKNIVRTGQFKKDVKFKPRFKITEDSKVLLFTGRVVKEKGIYEVIKAFEKIQEKFKTTLIIVGDGDDYLGIKRLVDQSTFSEKVIFTGFIPEKEVVKFYSNSDILVFPTFFTEGFPMALFNSIAAGLSIVTTPTRAAVDYLSEPQNCLWVLPQDSDSVYNALLKLLQSQTLATLMKVNNMKTANQFTKEVVSGELDYIIGNVLTSKGIYTCKVDNSLSYHRTLVNE